MAAECKDCGIEYHALCGNMVIVNDMLWYGICDDWLDCICSDCMEKRLGRELTPSDFKGNGIPVNDTWLENKVAKKLGLLD